MQLSDMVTRASQRLNESAGPVFYPKAEIIAAINEAQRFFCLLTLCLEVTASWTPSTQWTHMLTPFADFIVLLRITDSTGAKVRPASIADISALDPGFFSTASAGYYVSLGEFVGINPTGTFSVTYAGAPVALALDTDVPQIPEEYHPRLVEYAIYRCRQVEGWQEFAKSLPLFAKFLEGADHYAGYVRARNIGSRYDSIPFELDSFDRSKMLALRPDLMPANELPTGPGTAQGNAA